MISTMILVSAPAFADCTFTASVSDGDTPVSDARVLLVRSEGYETVERKRGTTDAKGVAAFEGLGPGRWRATAAAGDRVPGTMRSVTCSDADALEAELVLKPADAWFEGRLVDQSGRVLDGVVGIVDTHDHAVFAGPAELDLGEDGTYRIPVVSGYGYNLYGFSEGYRFGSTGLTQKPAAGERKQVEMTLSLAARIEGRVYGPDGQPVAGATVYRMPLSTEQATTDAQGRYWLPAVPGTLNRVSAISGNRVGTAEVGTVGEGEDRYQARIDLRPGRTVRGTVMDASRNPVGPTTVVWGASGTGLVVEVPVAADGTFTAEGVPYDWTPDPNRIYTRDAPADHVEFFVYDYDRKAEARKVSLPPSETTIDVPFALRTP